MKGLFSNILPMVVLLFVLYFHAKSEWSRGCTVNETQEFRQPFTTDVSIASAFESVSVGIVYYRGKKVVKTKTHFMDNDPSESANV